MFDDILLPTDGSPGMGGIIEQALHQAEQNDATIHALYVIDVRSFMTLPEETAQEVITVLKQEGSEAIGAVQEHADDRGIECTGEVVTGVPHQAILTYADDQEVDLIVMGTHGRTGEEQRAVGSVAEEVIRQAELPVLIARMQSIEREESEQGVPAEQRRYVQ